MLSVNIAKLDKNNKHADDLVYFNRKGLLNTTNYFVFNNEIFYNT